jgi:hypothetical protein
MLAGAMMDQVTEVKQVDGRGGADVNRDMWQHPWELGGARRPVLVGFPMNSSLEATNVKLATLAASSRHP